MTDIKSVPIMVIELLKRWRHRGPSTAADFAEHIQRLIPTFYTRRGLETLQQMQSYIDHRLEELRSIGMVSGNPDSGYVLTWNVPESGNPIDESVEDGRPPVPPDSGNVSGGGDDGAGIGVREVLMHPVLFSLSDEDFDALLAGGLGDGNDA